ncbi:MAG: hypothetical protein HY925_00445, partial [Elusimicrobia bacterium]|nr:hypothetical protein [Elusimicrobiota bacterium]
MLPALLLAPLLAASAQNLGLETSTTTQKAKQVLEDAVDEAGAKALFDGNRANREGGLTAAENMGGFLKNAAAAIKIPALGLKVAAVPAVKAVSDVAGKKPCCLDTLEAGPDGSVYRMRADHAWWKFWDSSKVIEQGIPTQDGAQYNKKGEFVGDWKTVLKTKADGYRVVGERVDGKSTGRNSIFTFEKKGGATEVGRDGKYVTTLGGNDLREIKIGADNKVYARYEKGREDVVVSIDPVTKLQQTVAKIAADYKNWQEWIPERGYYTEEGHYETRRNAGYYEETPGHYDQRGTWHDGAQVWHPGTSEQVWVKDEDVWHVTDPAHYETRTSRTGVTSVAADANGKVYTLMQGRVSSGGQVVSSDNVRDFSVDSKGTLYTVVNNKLAVNHDEPTTAWGSKPLVHD